MNKRNFLRLGSGLLVAAPVIVRASSLMPVRVPQPVIGLVGVTEETLLVRHSGLYRWNSESEEWVFDKPLPWHSRGLVVDGYEYIPKTIISSGFNSISGEHDGRQLPI